MLDLLTLTHAQVSEDLLSTPLKWEASPEAFLELVILTAFSANPDRQPVTAIEAAHGLEAATLDNIAAAFMEVITLSLAPYASFEELKTHGAPTEHLPQQGLRTVDALQEAAIIEKALTGTHVVRHPDSIAMELIADKWAEAFITRASKHIKFNDPLLSRMALSIMLSPPPADIDKNKSRPRQKTRSGNTSFRTR